MRRSTTEEGRRGEATAEAYLRGLGFRVVDRRWRGRAGEVDLIGFDGPVLAFIEVKTRSSDRFGDPLEAVGTRKQKRLVGAAREYLARRPHRGPVRFDVVSVRRLEDGTLEPEWIRGAFDAGAH